MFDRMVQRVATLLAKRRQARESFRISMDPIGIHLNATNLQRPPRVLRWDQILRIYVFKRDVYIHDMICMLIESSGGNIELDETVPGWKELSENLSRYLPSARRYEDWFLKVAFPALEPSPVEVYSRTKKAPGPDGHPGL